VQVPSVARSASSGPKRWGQRGGFGQERSHVRQSSSSHTRAGRRRKDARRSSNLRPVGRPPRWGMRGVEFGGGQTPSVAALHAVDRETGPAQCLAQEGRTPVLPPEHTLWPQLAATGKTPAEAPPRAPVGNAYKSRKRCRSSTCALPAARHMTSQGDDRIRTLHPRHPAARPAKVRVDPRDLSGAQLGARLPEHDCLPVHVRRVTGIGCYHARPVEKVLRWIARIDAK
jgi:hypothetical protein